MKVPGTPKLALLTALALAPAGAQQCLPLPRDLAFGSPRSRLEWNGSAIPQIADVAADASWCGRDSSALVRRQFRIRRIRDSIVAALRFPSVRVTNFGGVADPRDNGSMWSGRGTTLYGSAALSIDVGPAHILLAPAVWYAENRRFDIIASRDSARSALASPWYEWQYSADLPSRFGVRPVTQIELGASSLWAQFRSFDAGISASPQSWGPGMRAHLFIGPDAPGIPRVFVRTHDPIATPIGSVAVTGFLGALQESLYFDRDVANDSRGLWAWTAAINPRGTKNLTLGVSHGVLVAEGPIHGQSDQIITLFARVRSPEDAFRGWIELGRMRGLPTFRQFITVPYMGLAYVMGFEYGARQQSGTLLLSTEFVNVEQPLDLRSVGPIDFYTSSGVLQGFTQRGRVLGVSTGPGSQSQWVSLDWVSRSRWSAGVFAERVRWNEDAFLREYLAYSNRHDVTLRMGLTAAYTIDNYEASLQLSTGKRLNYLFQNGSYIHGFKTVDVSIPQLRVAITPLHR